MTNNKVTIKNENIIYDLEAPNILEIVNQLADRLLNNGDISDKQAFIDAVISREDEIPTSIGNEIAIPHGKSNSVIQSTVALGVLKEQIVWGENTNDEVKYVFLLAIKEDDKGENHLRTLANLSSKLMDQDFVTSFKNADSEEELIKVINNI